MAFPLICFPYNASIFIEALSLKAFLKSKNDAKFVQFISQVIVLLTMDTTKATFESLF